MNSIVDKLEMDQQKDGCCDMKLMKASEPLIESDGSCANKHKQGTISELKKKKLLVDVDTD